jgi:teichuronic acid biosynthesis glycosyltransferase TuaG
VKGSSKVSVVIPAFNQADYLREALTSVVSQTYTNLEVLVVNDGSTDGTRELVLEFVKEDSRFIYLEQENDKTYGLGARNWGMLNATGKWVALLDQDDIWYPNKIEKQINFLEQNGHIGCTFSPVDFIDKHGVKFDIQSDATLSEYGYQELIFKNYIYVSSGIFLRKLLSLTGLPNESSGYADWWLWLSLAKHTKIVKLDQVLAAYRIQPDSYQQKQLRQHSQKFAQDNLLTTLSQNSRVENFPYLKKDYSLAMNQRAKLYLRASYSCLAELNLAGYIFALVKAVRFSKGVGSKVKFLVRALLEGPFKAVVIKTRSKLKDY